MNNLRIERLSNGFYRLFDYASKLSGLYHADGTYRSGDLRINSMIVRMMIAKA